MLELAGLDVEVLHAPGHTEGSVMFGLDAVPDGLPPEEGLDRTMVSGDVLFAGSIGRTDLPGGDNDAMQRSCATSCCRCPTTRWCSRPRRRHDDRAASGPPTPTCED